MDSVGLLPADRLMQQRRSAALRVAPAINDDALEFSAAYSRRELLGLLRRAAQGSGGSRRPGARGTLEELFHSSATSLAPVPHAVLVETWSDVWYARAASFDRLARGYVLSGLAIGHTCAGLDFLGKLAQVGPAEHGPAEHPPHPGLDQYAVNLACSALTGWDVVEAAPPIEAHQLVDMDLPARSLPMLLLASRHDWNPQEQLAIELATFHDD